MTLYEYEDISRFVYTFRALHNFCLFDLRERELTWANFDEYIDNLQSIAKDNDMQDFVFDCTFDSADDKREVIKKFNSSIYSPLRDLKRFPFSELKESVAPRRNRVYDYFMSDDKYVEVVSKDGVKREEKYVIGDDGLIKHISEYIDSDISDDIFILMVDAINTYFHFDQYDKNEIRESMLACLIYLDYFYESIIYNRNEFLFNLLTNTNSQYIINDGKFYIMQAFLKNGSFVINVLEAPVWNIPREDNRGFEINWSDHTLEIL